MLKTKSFSILHIPYLWLPFFCLFKIVACSFTRERNEEVITSIIDDIKIEVRLPKSWKCHYTTDKIVSDSSIIAVSPDNIGCALNSCPTISYYDTSSPKKLCINVTRMLNKKNLDALKTEVVLKEEYLKRYKNNYPNLKLCELKDRNLREDLLIFEFYNESFWERYVLLYDFFENNLLCSILYEYPLNDSTKNEMEMVSIIMNSLKVKKLNDLTTIHELLN